MELEKHYLYSYYLSVKVKNDRNFDVGQMRMNVKPITCSSGKYAEYLRKFVLF